MTRDPIWDALVQGITGQRDLPYQTPRSERGRWNRAAKELREIEAEPSDVLARCRAYRRIWPNVALTPTALVSNWTQLGAQLAPSKKRVWEGDLDAHAAHYARTFGPSARSVADLAEMIFNRLPEHPLALLSADEHAIAWFAQNPNQAP